MRRGDPLPVAIHPPTPTLPTFPNSERVQRVQGDMIPWTVGQQYQDPEFPLLSGARIVRIAAHPEMSRAGYGSRAMQLLRR